MFYFPTDWKEEHPIPDGWQWADETGAGWPALYRERSNQDWCAYGWRICKGFGDAWKVGFNKTSFQGAPNIPHTRNLLDAFHFVWTWALHNGYIG